MGQIPSMFFLIAGSAIVSLVGFLVVHRLVKPIDLNEHQGFLDAMLNIVGTLVSILLGLLVAAALDHYRVLEDSVDQEAASVVQIYRISAGLPLDEGERLRKLCSEYSDQVVQYDWPAMAKGEQSKNVQHTYAKIIAEIVLFKPENEAENNLHNALLEAMQRIGDCRRQRILVLNSNWNSQLMPILIMCSAIVLVFAFLYVKRGAKLHAVLICFVAVALGGNIGMIFVLSNPFSGDWKLQPRGFELNRKLIKQVNSSNEFKQDFTDVLQRNHETQRKKEIQINKELHQNKELHH